MRSWISGMSPASLAKSAPNIAKTAPGTVRGDGGRAPPGAEDRTFAEEVAGSELGDDLAVLHDLGGPRLDDEEEVARATLGAQVLADVQVALLELVGDRGEARRW